MMEINDFPETNEKIPLAFVRTEVHTVPAMKKRTIPEKVAFRPTPEDFAIVTKISAKLGVDNSQVIRIALRRLFEAEGLRAS